MKTFVIYKAFRKCYKIIMNNVDKLRCHIIFWGNNITYKSFRTSGVPYVSVAIGGTCTFGEKLTMNNGIKNNPIGCYDRCTFFVDQGATLFVGNNLGVSQAAFICHRRITIGDNVKVGGGVKIYDTDFHSLNPKIRASKDDLQHRAEAPVIIKDNVFIGAYSIILKGVTIGENSIIGAGSVVTKSVPDNQIWAGNPAKFIKDI